MKLTKGTSFIIRARNEEPNVELCINSIVHLADEIIFVDNNSTDKTYQIAKDLAKKHKKIKVYKYAKTIPRCGEEQKEAIGSDNTIAIYYNWCLSKATKNNIIKWDCDFIANVENLKGMLYEHNLKDRTDKFALWFTGETLFIDNQGGEYIKKENTYSENRAFSKLHGFEWEDDLELKKWEYPSRAYLAEAQKERYDAPVFFEIKRTGVDELATRTGSQPLEERDRIDKEILDNLAGGVVDHRVYPSQIKRDKTKRFKRKNSKSFIIFHSFVPRVGGIETVVYNLAEGLNNKGYDVTLAYRYVQMSQTLLKYAKVANVINLNQENLKIDADYCLIASNHEQPSEIRATKWLQWVHSDYSKYNITLQMNPDVTKYVAVSSHAAKVIKDLYSIDCTVIPNILSEDFGKGKKGLKLLTVSRMTGEKGWERMVTFAKELQKRKIDFNWFVCGDNSMDRNYENHIISLFDGIPQMVFLGFKADVTPFLGLCDYMVLLSDFEGCPLAVLEALQMEVPCIVTDWGGCTEFVTQGKNGYIVPMSMVGVDYDKIIKKIPKFSYSPLSTIDDWIKIL